MLLQTRADLGGRFRRAQTVRKRALYVIKVVELGGGGCALQFPSHFFPCNNVLRGIRKGFGGSKYTLKAFVGHDPGTPRIRHWEQSFANILEKPKSKRSS